MKGRRGAEPVGKYFWTTVILDNGHFGPTVIFGSLVILDRQLPNEVFSGHLTQLLWASSEAVGCASANIWIPNKPGYVGEGMTSSYTVCHYSPQGNIIGHEKENYKPRRDGEFVFLIFGLTMTSPTNAYILNPYLWIFGTVNEWNFGNNPKT